MDQAELERLRAELAAAKARAIKAERSLASLSFRSYPRPVESGGVTSFRVDATTRIDAWPGVADQEGQPLGVEFDVVDVNPFDGTDREVRISGDVKWDGCCDWKTSTWLYAHLCYHEEAETLARCFRIAYALAGRIMPDRPYAGVDWPCAGEEWVDPDAKEDP